MLVATSYSKAVLRGGLRDRQQRTGQCDNVAYFPSYEIVTGPFARGSYFAEDLRSVTEEGVSHVMRMFFKYLADQPHVELAQSTVDGQPARIPKR